MTAAEKIPHSRPTYVAGMDDALARVLRSGAHAGGGTRREFEDAFRRRAGLAHACAVTSGYAALHLALLALGVKPGERVLMPSYVCAALLNAVHAAGGRPLLADIDRATFTLSAETARAALAREPGDKSRIACAIVPHMFGFPADLAQLNLGMPVIEDCAMALGASRDGKEVGSIGKVSVFSFYATKMISTGQGGMFATADGALANRVEDLLRYDNRERWEPSFNYALTDLAASMGLAQLAALDHFLARRRALALRYQQLCAERGWETQPVCAGTSPSFFRFVVLARDSAGRGSWIESFARAGIEAKSPVFKPLHTYLGLPHAAFAVTEEIHARAVSVPIYPSLSEKEQDRIVAAWKSLP